MSDAVVHVHIYRHIVGQKRKEDRKSRLDFTSDLAHIYILIQTAHTIVDFHMIFSNRTVQTLFL